MAKKHFSPNGEMTQGRKKITKVIKVVQFDNAGMKFCLVALQRAKETEDHFRPFLPRIPQSWHLMMSELMKALAGWRRCCEKAVGTVSKLNKFQLLTQRFCQTNLYTEQFW